MATRLGIMLPLLLVAAVGAQAPISLSLLLAAGTPCAQKCIVRQNTAFTLAADHAGVNTAGYRAYRDGVLVSDLPVSALQPPGVISFAFTQGLARGNHQLVVSAYNAVGQEAKSTPFAVSATPSGK